METRTDLLSPLNITRRVLALKIAAIEKRDVPRLHGHKSNRKLQREELNGGGRFTNKLMRKTID
jgi:hypothetical protein